MPISAKIKSLISSSVLIRIRRKKIIQNIQISWKQCKEIKIQMHKQNESTKCRKTAAKLRKINQVSSLLRNFPSDFPGGLLGAGGYAPERERVTSTEAVILNCPAALQPLLFPPLSKVPLLATRRRFTVSFLWPARHECNAVEFLGGAFLGKRVVPLGEQVGRERGCMGDYL